MKKPILLSTLTIIVFSITLIGCGPPPFNGGIRVVAIEQAIDMPSNNVGVAGVVDMGNAITDSFSGETDDLGIDDHPNAIVNQTWDVTADYTSQNFGCGIQEMEKFVPSTGAIFNFVCQL